MTTIDRKKSANKLRKAKSVPVTQAKKSTNEPPPLTADALRGRLVLTLAQFARLLPISVRSLATREAGTPPNEPVARRLTELERLTEALSEVMKKEALGRWLQTPNPAFDGSKPLELIEGANATGSGRWFTSCGPAYRSDPDAGGFKLRMSRS